MKKFIKKNKWELLLFILVILLICSIFAIEIVKNDAHKNNLTAWQNVFIGFIACDVTIISIFFGAFIPLLVGNVKENIPLKYSAVIKKKFFNMKKFSFVALMLIIHILQLIGCIYLFHYEPIIILFTIITLFYFLTIFYNGYQIYTGFNYAYYLLREMIGFSKMIQKDILKKKVNKRKNIKYNKKIDFIINAFPENKDQFNELGNLRLEFGIQLYYFAINIFSNGLFLYERFSFFKKNIYTGDIKYLKDDDEELSHEINWMEDILMSKLICFYSLCNDDELNSIFNTIRVNKHIILFGNLSYYGMSFLTKLHLKISDIKNWEIDNTWTIFLLNFIEKNMALVMIKSKKQLKCHNKKTAKEFVINNIYINPGLFFQYCKICNDKKALKKYFTPEAFQILHTYAATQSLFAIGRFSMENNENILAMLSLDNYKNHKFIFNKNIDGLVYELDKLGKYVEENEKMKNENKMFWVDQLKKNLEKSKIEVTKDDIKNIQFKKYDEISDLLLEEGTLKILNSQKFLSEDSLRDWTNKLYDYVLRQIEEKMNEFQLYNFPKYYTFSFPRPLLKLLSNLLRVELSIYLLDSKKYKNTVNTILDMKKYQFLITYDFYENDGLAQFINEKFNLIKEKEEKQDYFPYEVYADKWFDLNSLNTEDQIRKEKEKWEDMKKLK